MRVASTPVHADFDLTAAAEAAAVMASATGGGLGEPETSAAQAVISEATWAAILVVVTWW